MDSIETYKTSNKLVSVAVANWMQRSLSTILSILQNISITLGIGNKITFFNISLYFLHLLSSHCSSLVKYMNK